jgi:hypothetical protein
MSQSKLLLAASFVAIGLFLWGCDQLKDLSTAPESSSPATVAGQPVPDFSSTPGYGGTMATIGFDFSNFGITVPLSIGYAQFGQPGVDAGAVTVNGDTLAKSSGGSSVNYNSFNSSIPSSLAHVNFDGTPHAWIVSGSTAVPSFSGAVTSPSTFSIIKPAANDTISKTSGMAITWSGTSGSDSVMIVLKSTAGASNFAKGGLPNSGSYQIAATSLTDFAAGPALLFVVKYRYVLKASNSKNYVITSEIVKQSLVTIR